MEEILSSIRKMISDDRPGPSPMPDQLGRMAFGEQARNAPAAKEATSQPAASGGGSNFNSLADALKVATALSDQRRTLQSQKLPACSRKARIVPMRRMLRQD